MSTEAQERAVEQAALRLRVARAEVRDALNLLHEDATMRRADGFPRSMIMRALASREGRIMLGAAVFGVLAVRPRLIPLVLRVGRFVPVLPLLRGLLNRYLVRRNAAWG